MRMHSGDASYDSYGSHTGRGDSIDWSVRKHGQTESAPLGNIGFDGSIMAPSLMRRYITYARLVSNGVVMLSTDSISISNSAIDSTALTR